MNKRTFIPAGILVAGLAIIPNLRADEVSDWNLTAENAIKTAALNPGIQGRFMAIVHTAVYHAVDSIVCKSGVTRHQQWF